MRKMRAVAKVGGAATRRAAARWVATRWAVLAAVAVAAAAGCGDDGPTGPDDGGAGGDAATEVLVLNSTGQTLARFELTGGDLAPAGPPLDLGAGFDGDGLAVAGDLAASSVSSFGGSRLVLVDLTAGEVSTAAFPGPDAALVNPSRPTLEADGTLWVGGRGSDAVYRLAPDGTVAEAVAEGVGRFVERVLPLGAELFVVDANLDDDGGTFAPLGPGRVVVLRRDGGTAAVIDLPAGAPNPSDAVVSGGVLVVLAGGTFDPATFAPRGDGAVVRIDPGTREVLDVTPLGANGIGLEAGGDGRVYVTATTDFASLDVLRFAAAAGTFERGPADPLVPRDASGARIECWAVTALQDGRMLCVTFRFDAAGRLLLLDPDGRALAEVPSGFGSTDIALR